IAPRATSASCCRWPTTAPRRRSPPTEAVAVTWGRRSPRSTTRSSSAGPTPSSCTRWASPGPACTSPFPRSADMRNLNLIAIAAAAFAAGALGTWLVTRHAMPQHTAATAAAPSDKKVLYWYDPMVPQQHFDAPGKSPYMDMQLVPKYADGDGT